MNIIEMDKITKKIRLQSPMDFENCWHKVKLYIEKEWAESKYLRVFDWNWKSPDGGKRYKIY